jgi:H+/Cl- antiporter ClcA
LGSIVALAINSWTEHHVSIPAISLTCAAGVLAITQRAPIWAAIFVWELARPPWWLLIPFVVAAVAAHWLRLLIERRRLRDAAVDSPADASPEGGSGKRWQQR